jgi:hypothetical protein
VEGFFPKIPSYAHYCQTLIPHMPVPPESIHLHTHSPSVLTSLSRSRQQAGSGSLKDHSWCWTLSGRNHFPANSFTQKELITGQQASRSPELCAPTNTGKTNIGFPRTDSVVTGCSHGQDFRTGLHAQAHSAFPGQTETLPP